MDTFLCQDTVRYYCLKNVTVVNKKGKADFDEVLITCQYMRHLVYINGLLNPL